MVNDNKTGSFKSWMKENFEKSELERMLEYGADSGFDGLIYYSETCELYERFKTEIWEMLAEDTESPGYKNPIELIAAFNGAGGVASADAFENLLVWYAAERTAREITEENNSDSGSGAI